MARPLVLLGLAGWLLAGPLFGCRPGPAGTAPTVNRGTFVSGTTWPAPAGEPAAANRSARRRQGLTAVAGEVIIIEGDTELVSSIGDQFGLRFDAEDNDLASVARRAAEVVDAPGLLVLLTTFDDIGMGGPAYFVPFARAPNGTGRPALDQRAEFGVAALDGLVNLKRSADGIDATLLAHEISHQHVAYLDAVVTATRTLDLTGRQGAHWHAGLSSGGSLLEGHDWRPNGVGRFINTGSRARLSDLDLYLLGLLAADDVAPFFFIEDARTAEGAAIPPGADLPLNAVVFGRQVELTADDIIRTYGPRAGQVAPQQLFFALLTRPDETATSTTVVALAEAIDRERLTLERAWNEQTRGRGRLCTALSGCGSTMADGGGAPDAGTVADGGDGAADGGPAGHQPEGCGCSVLAQADPGPSRERGRAGAVFGGMVGVIYLVRRRQRSLRDRSSTHSRRS